MSEMTPDAPEGDLLETARYAATRGDLPQALYLLDRAVDNGIRGGDVLRLRGLVRFRLGQMAGAVEDLERAVQLLDKCAACFHELGMARLRAGQLERALEALDSCVGLDPSHAGAHGMRAAVLLRLRRAEEALDAITTAVSLEPAGAGMLHNRGVVLATLGRYREAIADYERALELEPDSGGTLNNLAWLLATTPDSCLRDGPRALALARRAVAAGRIGTWLDTLAAAHAECQEFEAAVTTETEAYERSRPPNPAFHERIEVYRRHLTLRRLARAVKTGSR